MGIAGKLDGLDGYSTGKRVQYSHLGCSAKLGWSLCDIGKRVSGGGRTRASQTHRRTDKEIE